MAHTCHAVGCNRVVPPKLFMCRGHWFTLTPELRASIWRPYVPGQENTKTPTPEYLLIAQEAINYIKEKEGARNKK